jgi:hypothetical protein
MTMTEGKSIAIGDLKIGDRIRLISMSNDPAPVAIGAMGSVRGVTMHDAGDNRWAQIDVSWDDGRTLMLVVPPDEFEIIDGDR